VNYHNLDALERLYNQYYPDQHQPPDGVNRHAISHGRWLDFDTIDRSLHAFLMFDMLHSMLEQLERMESEEE
jgi:hypothetical protein